MTIGELMEKLAVISELERELKELQNDDTLKDYIKDSKIEKLRTLILIYNSEVIE